VNADKTMPSHAVCSASDQGHKKRKELLFKCEWNFKSHEHCVSEFKNTDVFYSSNCIGNVNEGKFVIMSLSSKINWLLQRWKSRPHEQLHAVNKYRPTESNSMEKSRLLLEMAIVL
jgi:hypothetical protein